MPAEGTNRNPPWSREETILALDLYFKLEKPPSDTHPEVIRLSQTLNHLPTNRAPKGNEKFRNPTGVAMKLANLAALDPAYKGRGLQRKSKMDQAVWQEFHNNRQKLARDAKLILNSQTGTNGLSLAVLDKAREEVRDILIGRIQQNDDPQISYSELARQIKAITIKPRYTKLFQILDEVSTSEFQSGRRLLSAIVTHKGGGGRPGGGFFTMARRLGFEIKDEQGFWLQEIEEIKNTYKNLRDGSTAATATLNTQYWLELYWPSPDRDLTTLYCWFHDKKIKKNTRMKSGDRVLFYQVDKHPDMPEVRGSKTIFASGTITDKMVDIDRPMGKKRWIMKRLVSADVALTPEQGIPLARAKEILGSKGWYRTGCRILEAKFTALEEELRLTERRLNEERTKGIVKSFKQKGSSPEKPFAELPPAKFTGNGSQVDTAAKLAKQEKSLNSHRDILNSLNRFLSSNGYQTSENKQVDLFASKDGAEWIFEVKSTNDGNFLSQVRHGIAQLFEYRYKYRSSQTGVKLCLITQTAPPEDLKWVIEYLEKALLIGIGWPREQDFFIISLQGSGDTKLNSASGDN